MIGVAALLARLVAVAFVLAVVQAGWNAAQLPALSAAWFDVAGRPLWFVPTTRLAWAHVGIAALVAVATAVGLRRSTVGSDPRDGPHDHRRDAASGDGADPAGAAREAYGRRRAHERAAWRAAALGLGTLLALAALAQQVYDANREAIPRLETGAVLATGALYGVFVSGWSLAGRRRPSRVR